MDLWPSPWKVSSFVIAGAEMWLVWRSLRPLMPQEPTNSTAREVHGVFFSLDEATTAADQLNGGA